jgi:hypothetical protein
MHDAQRASRRRRLPETRTLVLTIGHSTHSIEAFIGLLQVHGAVKNHLTRAGEIDIGYLSVYRHPIDRHGRQKLLAIMAKRPRRLALA